MKVQDTVIFWAKYKDMNESSSRVLLFLCFIARVSWTSFEMFLTDSYVIHLSNHKAVSYKASFSLEEGSPSVQLQ